MGCMASRKLASDPKSSLPRLSRACECCWRNIMTKTANAIPLADRFPELRRLQTRSSSKQIPVIRQLSATDCGPACIAMVLAYHGKNVPLSEIREVAGVNRDGVDALTLLKTARWYG